MTTEEKFLAEFESDLSAPESYLQPSDHLRDRCLNGVKTVFDFYKKCCQETLSTGLKVPTGPLTELYTDRFDNEQIWEEIELLNEPVLKRLKKLVRKMSTWDGVGNASSKKTIAHVVQPGNVVEEEEWVDDGVGEDDQLDSDLEDDNMESSDEGSKVKTRGKKGGGRKSVVDDKFFKLAEMEQFLEMTEKEDDNIGRPDDVSDSGSEDFDYFADQPSEDDSEAALSDNPHYEDFFDAPDPVNVDKRSKEVKIGGNKEGNEDISESNAHDDDDGSASEDGGNGESVDEDGDSGEGVGDEDGDSGDLDMEVDEEMVLDGLGKEFDEGSTSVSEDTKREELSTHEKKQTKMSKKIADLEEVNLVAKSWQMGGETTGKGRPLNSLLEEELSFDHMTRPAPVVTEETTQTLEDIIKQRIIDEAWDDVERKVKPAEKPYDYSRSRPLEQEKSKLSLAEVYEQEYLKHTQASEDIKEDDRHTEIRGLMKKLFLKLDALSNFHFTPKPPKPDVKIVANVPAIQTEEVAPLAMSDATRLAPEELQEKSHKPEIGASEKSDTNRKQERRLKKRRKRLQIAEKKQREKVLAKLRPGLGNKFTRKSLEKKLKDREQNELVDNSLKSSSRFFAKLQEEVKEQVKSVRKGEDGRKSRTSSGQQFKL